MAYKILWTDMHSNIHHEQMNELPQWFDQVQKMMDFWPLPIILIQCVRMKQGWAWKTVISWT